MLVVNLCVLFGLVAFGCLFDSLWLFLGKICVLLGGLFDVFVLRVCFSGCFDCGGFCLLYVHFVSLCLGLLGYLVCDD